MAPVLDGRRPCRSASGAQKRPICCFQVCHWFIRICPFSFRCLSVCQSNAGLRPRAIALLGTRLLALRPSRSAHHRRDTAFPRMAAAPCPCGWAPEGAGGPFESMFARLGTQEQAQLTLKLTLKQGRWGGACFFQPQAQSRRSRRGKTRQAERA
jgi:hypothetical protein